MDEKFTKNRGPVNGQGNGSVRKSYKGSPAEGSGEVRRRSAGEETKKSGGEAYRRSASGEMKEGGGEVRRRSAGEETKKSGGEVRRRSAGDETKKSGGEARRRSTARETQEGGGETCRRSTAGEMLEGTGEVRHRSAAEEKPEGTGEVRRRSTAGEMPEGSGEAPRRSTAGNKGGSSQNPRKKTSAGAGKKNGTGGKKSSAGGKKSTASGRKGHTGKGSRKRRRRKQDMIERIILLVAVIVFCISLFSLVRIALEYKKGTDTYAGIEDAVVTQNTSDTSGDTDAQSDTEGEGPEQVNIPYVNMESLKQINPDSEGWLLFPDTKINYPVVYGRDNAYYLTRMIDGTANKAGTLFTDMNNGKGFSDRNTIIYGHNMKNGSMFGQLKKYGKEEYYQEHPSFYLYTEAGVWRYDIFSVRVVDEASDSYTINFASEEEFNTYIDKAFRTSMYDTGVAVTASDTIVTLSTCTSKDTDRLIVQGVRGEQIR